MFTFSHHVAAIASKALQRLKIMKAVSGSLWGHDKETLFITYRALFESVFNFAAPVWWPNCKPTNAVKLQCIQNAALHLITGCHLATSIDHLHAETKLMPVAEHLNMLCFQFLAKCLSPSHPSHDVVLQSPGPRVNNQGRPMKETLSSKFMDTVSPFLQNGIIPASTYNRTEDTIHTDAVRSYLASTEPNLVLGCAPPEIDPSELTLPHAFRTTLSQLRSRKCSSLRSYQFYIKATNEDICQSCHRAPHTSSHVFSCPNFPTTLTIWDLWFQPVRVADFLTQLPTFNHLPPLILQTPPPSPEPPP
jgi:hypothetical protein